MSFVYGISQIYFAEKVLKKKNNLLKQITNKIEKCRYKYFISSNIVISRYLSSELMQKQIKVNYKKANKEVLNEFEIVDKEYEILVKKASDYKINVLLMYGIIMLLIVAYFMKDKENHLPFLVIQFIIYTFSIIKQIGLSIEETKKIIDERSLISNTVKKFNKDLNEIVQAVDEKDIPKLIRLLKN
jgi:hypothetical protein